MLDPNTLCMYEADWCVCACDAFASTSQSINIYRDFTCSEYAKKRDTFPDFKVPMIALHMTWNQLSSLNFLVLIKYLFESPQLLVKC